MACFATEEDVKGLPKTYILVNEMDPLRDEGVNFYRLLRESDVDARRLGQWGLFMEQKYFLMPRNQR